MAFYELRQYVIREGKMAAWLKCMEEEIIPFQVAKGMVITGSYRGEKDDSVYVWIRRFESEEERDETSLAHDDPAWKPEGQEQEQQQGQERDQLVPVHGLRLSTPSIRWRRRVARFATRRGYGFERSSGPGERAGRVSGRAG